MYNQNIIWNNPISIILDKPQIDQLISDLPNYATGNWKHISNLNFEYAGDIKAKITIPYNEDSWRKGYLEFGNNSTVHAIDKEYLSKAERESVVKRFVSEVLEPYHKDHPKIKILYENF